MFVVDEVVSEFALKGPLDGGFGQLLQESILAEQVFGAVTILKQFVNKFRLNGHLSISFRESIRLRWPFKQNYL
jgi:hypothetical protein